MSRTRSVVSRTSLPSREWQCSQRLLKGREVPLELGRSQYPQALPLSGKFIKRKTLCHNVVTHRMNRDYVELLGLVPLENLHIESVPIGRAAREAETFVPNLDWSFDAPTMAKFGEDRNSFLICIVAIWVRWKTGGDWDENGPWYLSICRAIIRCDMWTHLVRIGYPS